MENAKTWAATLAIALALCAGTARAQQDEDVRTVTVQRTEVRAQEIEVEPERDDRPRVLIEATGAYGMQFGETDYLPSGPAGTWQHPLVHGYGVGATAGIELRPEIALIANYEYSAAMSSTGSLDGVIDEIEGEIDYHTVVAGVRLFAPLGPGGLQAELAGGVLMPFETELRVTHGPALTQLPTPITGTGTRIDHYSIGFGGHGLIGYRFDVTDMFYIATNIKLRLFESENSGETTELRNFVTDYQAVPPTATDAVIAHGEGAAQPTTASVQDVRGQIAIGVRL